MKKIHTLSLLALSFLTSCGTGGGGGGGGDFIGAAIASISISPRTIDISDRAEVRIQISEVNDDGIALKVRYPSGLGYVPSSSFLTVNGNTNDVTPNVITSDNDNNYLVYYFSQSRFGTNAEGELTILLSGQDALTDGKVEVDADVDDPLIDNASEFDIANPAFEAEDEASINVQG